MSGTGIAPAGPGAPAFEDAERRELARWQRRLLPFMSRFLVVLALGFFVITLIDAYQMRTYVKTEPQQAVRQKLEEVLRVNASQSSASPGVTQTLLLLEADALDKRYRQASALLLSRIWSRQLAFITGMVLAFIGAVFIIGKLSEKTSDVSVVAANWKAGISSTSPGLILAFFGTVLMGIALTVQPPIEIQDRPVYFSTVRVVRNVGTSAAVGAEKSDPDPFDGSSETNNPPESKPSPSNNPPEKKP